MQLFGLVNVMDIGQVYVSLITTIPNNCVYTCCPKGDNSDHWCWCWNVESSRRILILICIYLDSEMCQVEVVAGQQRDKILWEGLFGVRQCVAMALLIMSDISLCWCNDILRWQVFWVLILIANVTTTHLHHTVLCISSWWQKCRKSYRSDYNKLCTRCN